MPETDRVQLLTGSQVAEQVGVSTNTIRNWAIAGHLPFLQLPSGQRRYRPDDVLALVESIRDGGAATA